MSKKDPVYDGSKSPGADGWESPEMSALDSLMRQTLQVPKKELDRLLAEERSKKNGHGH
jgi:hypothetical protein